MMDKRRSLLWQWLWAAIILGFGFAPAFAGAPQDETDSIGTLLIDRLGTLRNPKHGVITLRDMLGPSVGDVILVQWNSTEIRSWTLLTGAVYFYCNEAGWYVWRNKAGEWFVDAVPGVANMGPAHGESPRANLPAEQIPAISHAGSATDSLGGRVTPIAAPDEGAIKYVTVSPGGNRIARVLAAKDDSNVLMLTQLPQLGG